MSTGGDYDDPRDPRDDRGDDYYDDPDGPRESRRAAAKKRVALPGMFLLIFGLISLFIVVMVLALWWISPDTIARPNYDLMKDLTKGQPQGQGQGLPPYEEFVKTQRVQATGVGILQLIGSILITIGGMKMRALQGYGLAVTASIMAIIPQCTNYCCCTSMPFGIWALVVLMNGDVKAAFRSGGDRPLRDDYGDRR